MRTLVTVAVLGLLAVPAAAQVGRVGGTVRDEQGRPVRGATVVAENPDAVPESFTAVTNDKGQFSMIGLRGGAWRFTASAPGFVASTGSGRVRSIGSNPAIEFRLAKGTAPGAGGVLAGVDAADLQAAIARAEALLDQGQHDEAIGAFREVLAKAPALTTVNLQIGRALRQKHDYDGAIALYRGLLDTAPLGRRAALELGMTQLEKGDLAAADTALSAVAASDSAGSDAFFALAEVRFVQGRTDEATALYQKAADAEPAWVKPWLKLGIVAANRGDREGAARFLERVVTLAPASTEATQAKAILEQLRR